MELALADYPTRTPLHALAAEAAAPLSCVRIVGCTTWPWHAAPSFVVHHRLHRVLVAALPTSCPLARVRSCAIALARAGTHSAHTMKLMIMLLISLLLATGVEAGPDVGSHANCVKKFDKCVKKHWKKNCPSPSPSPPAAPPSPFVAFTFTSKDSLLEAVKDFNKKPGEAEKKYGPIATWDVSGITDMSYLFDIPEISDTGAETTINADISDWDTSGVTNMAGMFRVRSARALGPTAL